LPDGDDEQVDLTYGQLETQARAIAIRLASLGAAGERALLLYPPGLEFITGFWGCMYARVVAVPSDLPRPNRDDSRLRSILSDAQVKFVLTTSSLIPRLKHSITRQFHEIIFVATDVFPDEPPCAWRPPPVEMRDLAYLQYTSGSTAAPKGVMISHGNVISNLRYIDLGFKHGSDSVSVSWLPHFHDMGLIYGILQPLFSGFRGVLMPPLAFIQQPVRWLRAISRFQATHSGGPNFAYDLCVRKVLLERESKLDLSRWRVAFNGAEFVRKDTLDAFSKAFGPCGFRYESFYPAYGLAEATLKVTSRINERPPQCRFLEAASLESNTVRAVDGAAEGARAFVSCGGAQMDTQIVVVNPTTFRRCSSNEIGELWVRGPGVANGYWNRPEETALTFEASLYDTGESGFLRTGDLGFLDDGQLYITGRLKDLIIIRGSNYYPEDIEYTARASHPALASYSGAAFSVEASGQERLVIIHEIDRHYTAKATDAIAAIRHSVARVHGIHAYSVALVKIGGIPKTSSGKIRRRDCRRKFLSGMLDPMAISTAEDGNAQSPEDLVGLGAVSTEESARRGAMIRAYLRARIASLLRVDQASILQQPLISLGLDSLMASELKSAIEKEFRVEIPFDWLLGSATLEQLVDYIQRASVCNSERKDLDNASREAVAPLSYFQERVLFIHQLAPNSSALNLSRLIGLKGSASVSAIRQAIAEVTARHESLRTSISTQGGRPVALIAERLEAPLAIVDGQELAEVDRPKVARKLAYEIGRASFTPEQSPLWRAALLTASGAESVLIVSMSHLISDAASLDVFVRDFASTYLARIETAHDGVVTHSRPGAAFPYQSFTRWQRRHLEDGRLDAQLSYWKEQLQNATPLEFPGARPRPQAPTRRGATGKFTLRPGLLTELREVCRKERVTLYMALLTAFKAALWRYTGQHDILISCPIAYRNRDEFREAIGCFANRLVMRTEVSEDLTFRSLLARVRDEVLKVYAHQDVPFGMITDALPHAGGNQRGVDPLSQVLFQLLKPMEPIIMPGLQISCEPIEPDVTNFDLFLCMEERREDVQGSLIFNTDLFDEGTVRLLMSAYSSAIETLSGNVETRLSEFPWPDGLPCRSSDHLLTITVTATFTAENLRDILEFWLQEIGLPSAIRFAPYGQVFQQLLDPESLVSKNEGGVNVILLCFDDWLGGRVNGGQELARNLRDFTEALRVAVDRSSRADFIVCVCPSVSEQVEAQSTDSVEALLKHELNRMRSVVVVTASELRSAFQIDQWQNAHGAELAHIPYTPEFFAALGTTIARRIYRLRAPRRKVIVLDCDQTLWTGVCGEEGALGVEIDPSHRALQEFMLDQQQAGMLLCLCSKNEEQDVFEVFDYHPGMILKRQHLVAWKVNWLRKSENLKNLAKELDLSLDSFIFVDDDPVEIEEVRFECPGVLAIQLPADPNEIPEFLKNVWEFDHLQVTSEDQSRTLFYQQRLERSRLQTGSLDLTEFLARLELVVGIRTATTVDFPRVAQLTQRTNQFNMTGIRRSESEVAALCRSRERTCLVVEAKDRFGDYGLIGVIIYSSGPRSLQVDTFLLSCRALGRRIERQMLEHLGTIAQEHGLACIEIPIFPTAKNKPALEFLNGIGTEFRQEVAGQEVFLCPAEVAVSQNQNSFAARGAGAAMPSKSNFSRTSANLGAGLNVR